MTLFRDALQAIPERVSDLDEPKLNDLMRELLYAQTFVARANAAEVIVNTSTKAKDGGADAMTPAPPAGDQWFGTAKTCWQFKAGVAGQPQKLRGEILKPIPRETIEEGGRVIFVCSGSTNGTQGEQDRRAVVVAEAIAAGLAPDRIEVIGSERLTTWINMHPAIASSLAGRPAGLLRLAEWERSDEHDVGWQPVRSQQEEIEVSKQDLDLHSGSVLHLHIFGHPGVGKSRFALELCKAAPWAPFVIYVRQAADIRVTELIASAVSDPGVRLVVVADEAQLTQLEALREPLGRSNGRVRLVTIGTCASPDPDRIRPYEVEPLEQSEVVKVVQGWHPGMPPEHREFVAKFSAGYIRLARLAAGTIQRNPTIDLRTLLEERHIQIFLDKMLGTERRASLYVVAVLQSVGWTHETESEGRAIAEHLNLSWATVREDVERFDQQYRIAPRGGRLRYISPEPLGIYLAHEAWRVFGQELKTLPAKLTEAGQEQLFKRLESLASSAGAPGSFAREQLLDFFPVADLNDVRAIRRWSALAPANPAMAASGMHDALKRRSIEERRQIVRGARVALISGLVRLSWDASTFDDAVSALALLAEAENETYSNNSTAEFLGRFTLWLSGTAIPYPARIGVLDKFIKSPSAELRRLAFRALTQVGNRSAFRTHRAPITRGMPAPEWQPASPDEHVEAVRLAVAKLESVAASADPVLNDLVGDAIGGLAHLLREAPVATDVSALFLAAAKAFPEQRERLHRRVLELLRREESRSPKRSVEAQQALAQLADSLADRSPGGRLRELTGRSVEQPDLGAIAELAKEFATDPSHLERGWGWLTSGESIRSAFFGAALATVGLEVSDIERLIESAATGDDAMVVCGYLSRRAEMAGLDWLEDWLDGHQASKEPVPEVVFEATWRLTPTTRGAQRMVRLIEGRSVRPTVLGQLAYSSWAEKLDANALRPLIELLAKRDDTAWVALSMLRSRTSQLPDESSLWEGIGLELATKGVLIRTSRNDGYDWAEWAKQFVAAHPVEIYSAVIEQQANKDPLHTWFLDQTFAGEVVALCVERDPLRTWEATRGYLEQRYSDAYLFTIGFPLGLIDEMDRPRVLAWAAANPRERVPLLAELVRLDFSDASLGAVLIDGYADLTEVQQAFHSQYISGAWSGPASDHWARKAQALREVIATTTLAGLRRWAGIVAADLDERAALDRQREQEDDLRGDF